MNFDLPIMRRSGHTLMELMVATIASSILMAGLASVMFIASEIAYTPTAAERRTETADIANQISDELRFATLIIQSAPRILEFVVADRNADGAAERIRYQWTGVAGAPLTKQINGGSVQTVLESVEAFAVAFQQISKTTSIKTTSETAETVLIGNSNSPSGFDRDITSYEHTAQQINPASFTTAIPANALAWNATRMQFFGDKRSTADSTLVVQLRTAGEPDGGPSSYAVAERSIAELSLVSGWNTIAFTTPARGLPLHRSYALVIAGSGGDAAEVLSNDNSAGGVLESSDAGSTWKLMPNRQIFYRLYGTFTIPSTTHTLTQNYVTNVELLLRTGSADHSRIESRIPLRNRPELLAAYWRADFDSNPTLANTNADGSIDWLQPSGSFNTATLTSGIWQPAAALETRPFNDFASPVIIDIRCRNASTGGNGAVMRINADRQGGQYGPLLVYVQRQSDDTQSLTLLGKTSDAATKQLFTRAMLGSGFVRYRLTVLPQHNVVNLHINDEDQGAFSYPTYAPSTTTDRCLTVSSDTSVAEFDYVEVRVTN